MWIITGQRDFYFVCGIFVWTIPRPWSSRSSNIEVRQTSITSHLTTFYHVACVAGFKREKGRGGGFWRSGNGVKSAQFPLLPLSPFNACTQAEWSPRRNCFCCHALWWGAVHDVKNTATQEPTLSATPQYCVSSRNASSNKEGGELCDNVKNGRTIEETFTYRCYFSGVTVKCMNNRKNTGGFQYLQNKHQINGKTLATDI